MSFKICAIGCGEWSSRVHGPSLRKYKDTFCDTQLVACCDIDADKATSYKNTFGFDKHYTEIDTMLDVEKPDAVFLAAPIHLTALLSIKVLECGYPIMMEKPPGLSRDEITGMIKATKNNTIPNMVAFNRRFIPAVERAKELIAQHIAFGDIDYVRYDMFRVGRSGNFGDTAVHAIDTVRHIANANYERLKFDYQRLDKNGKLYDNIYMNGYMSSGARAEINCMLSTGSGCERFMVCSSKHLFKVELPHWYGGLGSDNNGSIEHYYDNKLVDKLNGSDICSEEDYVTNGFYNEHMRFYEDIRASRKPVDDLVSAVQSVEVMECVINRASEYKA